VWRASVRTRTALFFPPPSTLSLPALIPLFFRARYSSRMQVCWREGAPVPLIPVLQHLCCCFCTTSYLLTYRGKHETMNQHSPTPDSINKIPGAPERSGVEENAFTPESDLALLMRRAKKLQKELFSSSHLYSHPSPLLTNYWAEPASF